MIEGIRSASGMPVAKATARTAAFTTEMNLIPE